jgi:starch phosphorylase
VDVQGSHAGSDYYLLGPDFGSYLEAQAQVDATYKDQAKWTKMSILSSAGCGKFSSDRTIREYAEQIWNVKPCKRPDPAEKRVKPRMANSEDPNVL